MSSICSGCDEVLSPRQSFSQRSPVAPVPRSRPGVWRLPILLGLTLLAGTAGLIGAAAYLAGSLHHDPADEPLTQTLRGRAGRARLAVPAGWRQSSRGGGEIRARSPGGTLSVAVFTEPKVILDQAMGHAEYARLMSEKVRQDLHGFSITVGPEAVAVGGRSAIRYQVTGRTEGGTKMVLLTVIEGDCHYHQVVASCPLRKSPRDRLLLERITNSFQELE